MKILVLDTIHGGAVLAEALLRKGFDVDAIDIYRGKTISFEEAEKRNYDIITAPVHLDPDHPLKNIKPVITHHEMTARLCTPLPCPLIEITGARGKTTTAFALAHILGQKSPGIIHTSRGTFWKDTLLFKKSITPASLLFARAAAEKEHANWIIAEESLGVCGCGDLGILTGIEDYPIAAGKLSALQAKLTSLKRCKKVLVPKGIQKEDNRVCADDLVRIENDTAVYETGQFTNPLLKIPAYRDALKTAAAAAILLGYDPAPLAFFEAVEGRMKLTNENGVIILDNANSGTNAACTIDAAKYLRTQTAKEIYLVIGEEKHAVCEGFTLGDERKVIDEIHPAKTFFVRDFAGLKDAKDAAVGEAKKEGACVLLAVKTWR